MTTFAAFLVIAAFGYAVYRYLPKGAERAFRLERFHPGTPMSDWTPSYYDAHRRYADLAAVYGRSDMPDEVPPVVRETADTTAKALPAQRSQSSVPVVREPAAGLPKQSPIDQYAWRSRRTVARSAGGTRKPERGVRRLVSEQDTLDSKAS
ncbi:hypothetical protein [Nocardia suismassiliense]|uniref:hypothetical protein n=1 Tax=Nocardia suismassiliense TaxID=2077092 RepID=UPI000D1F78BF|nr:hypothetical protein [Nocardia suismassiliense]